MSLINKVMQFLADAAIVHTIVHGTSTETVTTEGGEVASLAKVVNDCKVQFNNATSGDLAMSNAAKNAAEAAAAAAAATVGNSIRAANVNNLLPVNDVVMVPLVAQNLPVGNSDLYTVPAGKRAYIPATRMSAVGVTGTAFLQLKVGGNYYRISGNISQSASPNNTMLNSGSSGTLILEEGETYAVNTSVAGASIRASIFEFPNTEKLRSYKKLGLNTVSNITVHTVPDDKLFVSFFAHQPPGVTGVLPPAVVPGIGISSSHSTGNATINMYLVPSGGTVGDSSKFFQLVAAPGNPINAGSFMFMDENESIVVNTDVPSANGMAWVTGFEFDKLP